MSLESTPQSTLTLDLGSEHGLDTPLIFAPRDSQELAQNIPTALNEIMTEGEKLADGAPPLTSEQADRIVSVLRLNEGTPKERLRAA